MTPAFKKFFVAPLLRFVPYAIPANIITIFANMFVYVGLYLAIEPTFGIYNRIVISLCLIAYLIGDHLDGMQAKRTGTGSALGEFCDHYLDAFNNGIVLFTLFSVFEASDPILVGGVIACSYLAHMAVFYEQFKTGWLTFEKFGSLEGVMFAAILIALSSFSAIYDLLMLKVIFSLSVFHLTMIATSIGALVTFFQTFARTPNVKSDYWAFTFLFIITTALCAVQFTAVEVFVIQTLYASLYIGRVMRGHLVDGVERSTDWPTVLYLLLLFYFEFSETTYSFLLLTGYLAFCVCLLVVQVFATLKVYWVWQNIKS